MEWSGLMIEAMTCASFVVLLLVLLRRAGVIRNLGVMELAAIGIILHVPYLLSPGISISLSVALNIVLILRVQEVGEGVDAKVATARATALQEVAAASAPFSKLSRSTWSASSRQPGSGGGNNGAKRSDGRARDKPKSGAEPTPAPTSPRPAGAWVEVPQLTAAEHTDLCNGGLVLKQLAAAGAKGNEGLAAQRVDAPVDLVWATLCVQPPIKFARPRRLQPCAKPLTSPSASRGAL
jgi:hypothetical protein